MVLQEFLEISSSFFIDFQYLYSLAKNFKHYPGILSICQDFFQICQGFMGISGFQVFARIFIDF